MKSTFYNNFDIKNSKGWARDSLGRKRLLRFKTIISANMTLVLLNLEYARYTGYFTVSDLLKANGLSEIKTPIWLDPKTGKIYSIINDQLYDSINKDPEFKVCALFAPNI